MGTLKTGYGLWAGQGREGYGSFWLSPIASCLWPGLYTEGVYFSPNRAIPCTSCNVLWVGIVENRHYSWANGIGSVARQHITCVQNSVPAVQICTLRGVYHPEKSSNVPVSSR